MISFDTNILVYATSSISDVRVMRARDLVAQAMRTASRVLLLQALAEFTNVAIRKVRIPVKNIGEPFTHGVRYCRYERPTKAIL